MTLTCLKAAMSRVSLYHFNTPAQWSVHATCAQQYLVDVNKLGSMADSKCFLLIFAGCEAGHK